MERWLKGYWSRLGGTYILLAGKRMLPQKFCYLFFFSFPIHLHRGLSIKGRYTFTGVWGGRAEDVNKNQLAANREGRVMHVYMRMIVNKLDGGLRY